ncbi:hypothetical protein TcBrA4_0059680 [Trypanosoma cruzi]|nr:hypothetical protein TcBrA4_0059680 [Trypanosoma cruzi]
MINLPDMWTPEQRRQHVAEMYRNKGLICPDYFLKNECPRSSSCSYIHIRNGETRKVPLSVCHFYAKRACLRDKCVFFHGTQAQLDQLHAMGAQTYRPQDYMAFAIPPPELLGTDQNVAPPVVTMPMPVPAPLVNSTMPISKPATNSPLLLLPIDASAATPFSMYWPSSPCQYRSPLSPAPIPGLAEPRPPAVSHPYTVFSFFQ